MIFVCAGLKNGDLVIKSISSALKDEASNLFLQEFGILPQEILGPFNKKHVKKQPLVQELKFTNQKRKAIYNDWVVNAFILQQPIDQAYLIFIKRADNQKIPFPKGTTIVPINDLRFIEC